MLLELGQVSLKSRPKNIILERKDALYSAHANSDVVKDLGYEAKARTKDLGHEAKAKAKDLGHEAKDRTKDLGPESKNLGSDIKEPGLEYQGQ